MNGVKIDLEKMQIETSISASATYEALEKYYKGNDEVMTYTFPIMVFDKENKTHAKRFFREENGKFFYMLYPWTFIAV